MSDPIAYTLHTFSTEAAWLKFRVNSIGASEAAAVCGFSKYCGQRGLYWRKLEAEFVDDHAELGDFARAGHELEPICAARFTDATGLPLVDLGDYAVLRSIERPHMTATVDRMIPRTDTPVEIKCAWFKSAKEWGDRVPIAYQIQLQHQLYVTGADEGYFAFCANGYKHKWYRMARKEKFIRSLCERCDQFWEHVEKREPPAADGQDLSVLYKEFPSDNGKAIALEAKAVDAGREFLAAQREVKAATERMDNAKAVICEVMGDASYGQMPSGAGFSWKADKRGRRRFTVADRVILEEIG